MISIGGYIALAFIGFYLFIIVREILRYYQPQHDKPMRKVLLLLLVVNAPMLVYIELFIWTSLSLSDINNFLIVNAFALGIPLTALAALATSYHI